MAIRDASRQDLFRLYTEVFQGETDRIPLIVSPPCAPEPPRVALAETPETAVVQAAEAQRPKAEAGTDWIPTVNISWYQCIVVPSVFGAEPVAPAGSEPIVKPVFRSIDEAAAAGAPPLEGPVVEQMLQTLETAILVLPEDYWLSFPASASPFDLAQLLLPGDVFLMSLRSRPDAAAEFLGNLTSLCIEVTGLVRSRLAGTGSEFVTNRGLCYPGLRLPCDALVNLSPDLIRDIALPIFRRFGERFGRLCIHYCTKPAASEHVLPVLCECDCVGAVDTWQGPDAFLGDGAPARMQHRVALIFDADLTTEGNMDSLVAWPPVRDVPRRNGRGLVLQSEAASVEEAIRIYALWRAKTG
ncbi:MAG TPA: hypothetical protein HPP83_11275 [Candidatus Hydrogenedentes bacterium]|nr:hypothetical protein [Candidatus Hydrogenedentota bacterium]